MILRSRDGKNKSGVTFREYNDIDYISLDGDTEPENRLRAPGELVLKNGWISLDYDDEGFLVGMEFHKGDPFTGKLSVPEYLQPKNPLDNKRW